MDQWNLNPPDDEDPYAPDCSSRAAEGFYVGALYGAVWGLTGRAASTSIFPSTTPMAGGLNQLSAAAQSQIGGVGGLKLPVADYFRAFGRGVAGYGVSAVSTAGVFGVFLGVVNAGTCACERIRGEKDWVNNMLGGGAAGLSVALLSRHTRTPRILAAHAVGAAAITSAVAIARGRPAAG